MQVSNLKIRFFSKSHKLCFQILYSTFCIFLWFSKILFKFLFIKLLLQFKAIKFDGNFSKKRISKLIYFSKISIAKNFVSFFKFNRFEIENKNSTIDFCLNKPFLSKKLIRHLNVFKIIWSLYRNIIFQFLRTIFKNYFFTP